MKDGIDSFAGGAISVGGPFAKVTIHSSSLTGHQAGQGGAIFVTLRARIDVSDSTFSSNNADRGAALFVEGGGKVQIRRTHFGRNAVAGSSASGGAIAAYGATVEIDSSTFNDNSAEGTGGGAIFISDDPATSTTTSGSLVITDTEFSNNTASGANGGAIAADGGARVALTAARFKANTAQYSGGAVFFGFETAGLLKVSAFNGSTTGMNHQDDVSRIAESRNVSFACPEGFSGPMVLMSELELLHPLVPQHRTRRT